MKTHLSFAAELLTATLICLCVITALATSGSISFNGAEIRLGAHTILRKDEYLTTEAGASVPSTMLYTNETGETTCYVPINTFAKAIGTEAKWMGDSQIVRVSLLMELQIYGLSTDMEGTNYNHVLEEIAPVPNASGKTLLKEKHYHQEAEAVTAVI